MAERALYLSKLSAEQRKQKMWDITADYIINASRSDDA